MGAASAGTPSANAPPLRVGILVDSYEQPAWVARALERVLASPHAELALVVRRGPSEAQEPPTDRRRDARLSRFWRRRRVALAVLYARLDKLLFPVPSNPLAVVDIEPLVAGCPLIDVVPTETRFSDFFSDEDAAAIDEYRLDVAVRFGFRILRGRALSIARHGVWSWHHGDNLVNRGGPPGFWEVMQGSPTTGSILQILTDELDAGEVLYRSWSRTDPRSVHRNRSNYYWKSAAFLERALRRLHEHGRPLLAEDVPWRPYSHPLYREPTNGETARGIARLSARFARDKVRAGLRPDQWFLAYRFHPKGADPEVPDTSPYRFRELLPPKDRFWADPFPALHEGHHWILFEERISSGPGRIAAVEVGPSGVIGTPIPVLERPYHLSYPFIFEWEGATYMVPETEENRTVELYRAEAFPTRWTLDRVLLSGVRAVDSTLAQIDGRWWMFVNIAESDEAPLDDELHLYSADSPLGPWLAHPRNPVKSDVRSARPAGRPFRFRGAWYRPSQDCSGRYGAAVVVNRITRLDETAYTETELGRLLPAWRPNLVGTHTLNAGGGLTVIDAQRLRPRTPFTRRTPG